MKLEGQFEKCTTKMSVFNQKP